MRKQEYTYHAVCINVIDGDTADFVIDLGFKTTVQQRIRFMDIDAPEVRTLDAEEKLRGIAAKQFVESQILGRQVTITTYKDMSFDRYLGKIFFDNDNDSYCLNELLLSSGHAVKWKRKK